MSEQSIARRYAKAIFELALESGTPDLVRDNLTLARDAIARTPEFCAGLLSPEVPRQEKRQLVEKFIYLQALMDGKSDAEAVRKAGVPITELDKISFLSEHYYPARSQALRFEEEWTAGFWRR